ncbi:hypothetical protein [Ornithinicoccus hortensis]|uniref:Uncharacterized protein n=1 Tax=Ornithinicoccus hortensis TaxID=82346 RepID=A0A542YMX8_9MICO|nr:hypothetical protein [Ornithinicoccus hortensis]TQL49453.1 hypothetical protein FB467_0525 [Ornithinicoccus hortensis]
MPAEAAPVPSITLLGPQRNPHVDQVLSDLGISGRIALVNAGWREREPDDELLRDLVGGDAVNLRLWHRMQEVWDADPEFADADRHRRQVLEEMQDLYLLGLGHVDDAIDSLRNHHARSEEVHQMAIQDVERIMRGMDKAHLARVSQVHAEFWERWRPHERMAVAAFRELISHELADVSAVVITGGHVGVLTGALHLFNVAPRISSPVIAWGAGAMALTDQIVLFHDRAPHGPSLPEVFSTGVGLLNDVVVFPSARERLDLGNHERMAMMARRFAPAESLLLEQRARVDVGSDGLLPEGAPVLQPDGTLKGRGAA